MTIDVNVTAIDDDFREEIDEIIEDTMVQMFFLHPQDTEALQSAKEDAAAYTALFYVAPASLKYETDAGCVGYRIKNSDELAQVADSGKALFIDEADLDDALTAALVAQGHAGIILNATQPHETLERFCVAIGPSGASAFDTEALSGLSMDRIVMQSGYPSHDFDEIMSAAKTISDAMFRPEQSIIARATKQTLALTGFKK